MKAYEAGEGLCDPMWGHAELGVDTASEGTLGNVLLSFHSLRAVTPQCEPVGTLRDPSKCPEEVRRQTL